MGSSQQKWLERSVEGVLHFEGVGWKRIIEFFQVEAQILEKEPQIF